MPTTLADLLDRVLTCHAGSRDGLALPHVRLRVAFHPKAPLPVAFVPMLYFVLQGTKQLTLGRNVAEYRAGSMVVMAIDLPATSRVTLATPCKPYVAIELALELSALAEMIIQQPGRTGRPGAYAIDALPIPIVDPLYRLIGLLETPEDAPILAPMFEREIIYHALRAPAGVLLHHLVSPHGDLARISATIAYMRTHLSDPLRIEALAHRADMSVTTFHRHFKAVTSLSPIAFHRQLRLQEARRQVLTRPRQIAQIAMTVGYGSVSHFTRDYSAHFGTSPARDAASTLAGTLNSMRGR